ncbi:hypothetical protein N7488_011508 [Penicillium malachiteum]|nr:hypothetical protein N7488_011508 [Penicillium malachiteum]
MGDAPIEIPESITPPALVNGGKQHYVYPEPSAGGDYRVLDQYHSKAGKLRVACVGAGATGLCLA